MSPSRRKSRGNPRGRKARLLEPGVYAELVTQCELGSPLEVAATAAGVSARTVSYWLQRGHEEDQRVTENERAGRDPDPNPDEALFLEFYRDMMQARAKAARRNVNNIQRVAQGGFVTEETTRTYRNDDGDLVTETTVKRAAPDWRASAWFLERRHGEHFGKDARVEITGAGGGPIQVGSAAAAEELAARIAANVAALRAAEPIGEITMTQVDTADVEDATVVD